MHVLLLAGGKSNERDVSLRSGKTIADALTALGYEFTLADSGENGFDLIEHLDGIDVVFMALHGAGGEDGTFQRKLEDKHVPYVGSDSKSSALCFDKWAYKKLLQDNGISASVGFEVTETNITDEIFNKPYVLKPIEGGSSLDTQIARVIDDASRNTSNDLLKKYLSMLLEPLIEGIEITVGIFDQEPLPIIEIIPPEGLEFDYENKYNGATQELCPPKHVEDDVQLQAQELALKIHNLCGCSGMSRTDMIIDKNNKLQVLETNTIPGLTETSLLPKMVKQAGYTMPEFVDKLLQLAIKQ